MQVGDTPCRQCHRPHQPEGRERPSLHQGCDGAGVHLVVLSQREFDTTTPTDQLLLHLTLAIAEWEWSNIRERSIPG